MYLYYVNMWANFDVLLLCFDICDYTVITSWMSSTCVPNEAPGRNIKLFGLLLVGLTKLLVEAKLWGLLPVDLTKLLVEA